MSRVDIVLSAPTTRADGSSLDPSEIASVKLMSGNRVVWEAGTPGQSMSVTDNDGSAASTYTVRTVLNDGTSSESSPAGVEVVSPPSPGTIDSAKFYG